jgi:hypothetical protein
VAGGRTFVRGARLGQRVGAVDPHPQRPGVEQGRDLGQLRAVGADLHPRGDHAEPLDLSWVVLGDVDGEERAAALQRGQETAAFGTAVPSRT